MARHKIDIRRYVNTHGKAPEPGTFGTWLLVRDNGGSKLEISRTCYWRELVRMWLEYKWTLLP